MIQKYRYQYTVCVMDEDGNDIEVETFWSGRKAFRSACLMRSNSFYDDCWIRVYFMDMITWHETFVYV